MPRTRIGVTAAVVAVLLAGCMQSERTQSAAGDLQVDSLSATRTALLRIQNDYPSKVRIFTVLGGQANEVASVTPNGVRTVVLDPNVIPNTAISFEMRPEDGSHMTKRLGPFNLNKGETAELVVMPTLDMSHIGIHRSTP